MGAVSAHIKELSVSKLTYGTCTNEVRFSNIHSTGGTIAGWKIVPYELSTETSIGGQVSIGSVVGDFSLRAPIYKEKDVVGNYSLSVIPSGKVSIVKIVHALNEEGTSGVTVYLPALVFSEYHDVGYTINFYVYAYQSQLYYGREYIDHNSNVSTWYSPTKIIF